MNRKPTLQDIAAHINRVNAAAAREACANRVHELNERIPTFRAWLLSTASRPILTLALANKGL